MSGRPGRTLAASALLLATFTVTRPVGSVFSLTVYSVVLSSGIVIEVGVTVS